MSSTAGTAIKGPAPWKASFLEHINKMPSPEFVLSTVHPAPKGEPVEYLPRARFCIFRGFWAELPENKHNEAPKNERVFESEMPTFTSDVRMLKIGEIFGSSAGHASSNEQVQGTGGGGPVEAVWWVKETGTQWRMKGHAFVVGPDVEGDGEESSGVRTVKSELGERMLVVKPGKEGEWSWQRELTGHFGNNSPGIRGSFRAPPPGQPTSEPYDEENLKLGMKVEDLNDPVARKNFRVVVIKPESMEQLDLSDPVKSRRQKYRFNKDTAGWDHEETWP